MLQLLFQSAAIKAPRVEISSIAPRPREIIVVIDPGMAVKTLAPPVPKKFMRKKWY